MPSEWTVSTLKEYVDALRSADLAIRDRQAIEYERRLSALNHENERLSLMKETFVSKEMYQKDVDRLYNEKREADKLAEENRRTMEASAVQARRNNLIAWASAAIALIGWGITLVLHYT